MNFATLLYWSYYLLLEEIIQPTMLAVVSLPLLDFKWGQCQVSMRWSWDCLESLDEPSCPKPRICHHWCMEYDIATCFFRDGCPRWWPPPALTTARDVCPIRKRALGMPSARVKFLAPRHAKNKPLFLKKGKLGKNIVFLEVKNATMWIDVCQPSLGESFGWKLPNCNAGYQFL